MDDLGLDRSVFSEFVAKSAEAICVIDDERGVIDWNSEMQTITGIDSITAKNSPLSDSLPYIANSALAKNLTKAIRGVSSIADNYITIKDKSYSVSFSTLPGENSYSVLIILRPQETKTLSRFQPLAVESPIATAIYEPNGKPKFFNKAYGKIWDTDIKKPIDESYNVLEDTQLVELGIMPLIEESFKGVSSELPPVPFTPTNTHKINGKGTDEQKYIKGHIFPIKDNSGKLEEVVMVLSDVTYQKKAEEILSDTHIKFQMLTKGIPGVIYEFLIDSDQEAKFKYISEGCEEMFGVSSEKVLEKESLLVDVIHPDDRDSFLKSSRNSDKELKVWQWEGRIVVKGEVKWIEGKSSAVKNPNGSIIRYGVFLDITEKKKVEEQFKLTEDRLQLALEGAEMGLWEWDNLKRKTFFNKGWAAKFGYKPGELEKRLEYWARLIHHDDIPEVRKKLNNYINGKADSFEAEYRLQTKGGDYRWILDKGKAVERDDSGKILKAAGTYLDIDEKKNSELIIKRNEQLFTQLFESSPLGIVLLDDVHKIIQMNKGFEDIFGYKRDEIVGNKLNNVIVPDELSKEAIDINIVSSSGNVGSLQTYRKAKNGQLIPVIIYGVPVKLDNKTIGVYGIYVDITERKKAEEELQIRNNELDNFVYKVSHDLRAPLSSILGLVHLANHEQNEDDVREYMSIIENRVQQLDSFINDVLSHSKNLKLAVSYEKINLSEVIDRCFNDLNYLPKANLVKKEIDIDGIALVSDPWRINEIFRNLISNAIKYLNPDIDAPFIKIDIKVSKDKAVFTIADNGIGIDAKNLPNIFEMFYRATERSEGSGIGLYIVKNAVEKLGGQINIESEIDKGTIFKLELPNNTEESA